MVDTMTSQNNYYFFWNTIYIKQFLAKIVYVALLLPLTQR